MKILLPNTTAGFRQNRRPIWRRDNVDLLIKALSENIKRTKPWVKFGISPFGVWRNKADDPEGSETTAGTTNYDHLYADILKWQKNGWIDYCLPQLYWQIGHPSVDFLTLSKWWAGHAYNRAMYIGQAVYKLEANSTVANGKIHSSWLNKYRSSARFRSWGVALFTAASILSATCLVLIKAFRINYINFRR